MDEDNIKTLLEEEIAGEFGELSSLQVGSEEHTRAVDNLVKLYKLRIDETKADMDYREKRDQMKDEALGRYVRLGAELAGIVLPLMFYANWMKKGFEFEETGTFTSTTFKSLFNRFKPTGK